MDYLANPGSRQRRVELVTTFAAQKTDDRPPEERLSHLPEWIATGRMPVPSGRGS